MLEHLGPDEITRMPVHMQILYYLEKWGSLVQAADDNLGNINIGGDITTVSSPVTQKEL